MISDLLTYMTRSQLESVAKEERVQHWRYPSKKQLIEAIRKKRLKNDNSNKS